MKTFLVSFFIFFSNICFASNYDSYFEFDKEGFKSSFVKSNIAESFLLEENNLNNFNLLSVTPNEVIELSAAPKTYEGDYRIAGMKPFAFSVLATCVGGIILGPYLTGPIAWLVVYLDSDKDKEATKSARNGCLLGNGVYVVLIAGFISALYFSGALY